MLALLLACAPAELPSPTADAAPVSATEDPPTADARPLGPPIAATLSFDDRAGHMVDVSMQVPASAAGSLTLSMPTWTPGSYLIREYARHVEGFQAFGPDGAPLSVTRSAKNRWTIDGAAGTIDVRYRIYCRDASVRGNFVDVDMAVLNGAPTFMQPVDSRHPWTLNVSLPPGWEGVFTGLSPAGAPHTFAAESFDELVDSPLVIGSPVVRALDLPGPTHRLVLAGELGPWQVEQSASDVARIVATQQKFWNVVPYEDYTFLQVVNERGGGLEHLDSTLMQAHRADTSSRDRYVKWLGLVSHEFFHTWNIKRLRPAPLGPFDYEHEAVTPSLWVAEGLTSYYDDLLLARAGLMTDDEYLGRLTKMISGLRGTPGRRVQTLQQSSADAWIKHYRRDENSVNTAVSYYRKGALVGFILDAAVREASGGERSLDDVMRTAYARYSGEVGYTPAQFEATISEVAGADLSAVLDRCLRSTEELDYGPALAWYGLRFAPIEDTPPEPGDPAPDPAPAWLGADTADQSGRRVITHIKRGTPAHTAGLQVDDELIAIDGWRIDASGEGSVLAIIAPGSTAAITVSRLGKLRTVEATLGDVPADSWTVELDPEASEEAIARRSAWLGTDG